MRAGGERLLSSVRGVHACERLSSASACAVAYAACTAAIKPNKVAFASLSVPVTAASMCASVVTVAGCAAATPFRAIAAVLSAAFPVRLCQTYAPDTSASLCATVVTGSGYAAATPSRAIAAVLSAPFFVRLSHMYRGGAQQHG